MSRILLAILLLFPLSIKAEEFWPDRIYLSLATQHFGLGEEVFGVNGPNEINPGVGFGWDDEIYRVRVNTGIYLDSYAQPAVTLGLSQILYSKNDWDLLLGVQVTKSLSGDKELQFDDGSRIINARLYSWPYFQLEHKNFYLHLRAAINENDEAAGVFAFGLKFDVEDLKNGKFLIN